MIDQVFPFSNIDLNDENRIEFSFHTNDIPLGVNNDSLPSNVRVINLDDMVFNMADDFSNEATSDSDKVDILETNLRDMFDVVPITKYSINGPSSPNQLDRLSICSFNIVSIPDKLQNFIDTFDNLSAVDIFGFCETRLEPNIENLHRIPSYASFHQSRNRNGGGVSLYIKQTLHPTLIPELTTTDVDIECVAAEFVSNNQKCLIAEIYRPHKNYNIFLTKIEDILNYIKEKNYTKWYLMGDFNSDLLKRNDPKSTKLINLMCAHASLCTITKPTRLDAVRGSATLIDHIWTSDFFNSTNNIIIWDDMTDHFPICSSFKTLSQPCNHKFITRRKFTEAAKVAFSRDISEKDWNDIYCINDANDAYDIFIDYFSTLYDRYFPKVTVKIKLRPRQSSAPYMTPALRDMYREKRRLHRLAKRWPITHKQAYIDCRNTFDRQLKHARNEYYKNLLQSHSGDPKPTWKIINDILGRNKPQDELIDKPDDVDISHADFINNYFIETVDNLMSNSQDISVDGYKRYLNAPAIQSIHLSPVKPDEINKYIRSVRTKACGIDEISPEIVKLSGDVISEPLAYLINLSFKTGVFPDKLKVAKVIPIHKKGNKRMVENKRPISLLNIFCKIYEKAIYNRIYNYIEKHKLITPHQHGFRTNHSTESAIINFINNIYNALENRNHYIGICIDFSKAFDCLNHRILIDKLENIGVRGPALALMTDYLLNRKQITYYNNNYSKPSVLHHGTPQGSQLGPLLFAIYINDLVNASRILSFELYADDSNAGASGPNLAQLTQVVNVELAHVNDWIIQNHLSANNTKLLHLLFSTETDSVNYQLKLGNYLIPRVNHTKLLGVIIDDQLKWSQHTTSLSKKLSQLNGVLYLCRNKLSSEALKSIYYSLAYSHLSYCVSIWGGTWAKHLKPIITAQKRLLKTISFAPRDHRSLPLFVQNQLLTFENIFVYFSSITAFKFIHFEYCYRSFSHQENQRELRNNENKLFVPFFRTTRGQKSVFYQTPKIWNSLPSEIRLLTNVHTFKFKLKLFLKNQQSQQI